MILALTTAAALAACQGNGGSTSSSTTSATTTSGSGAGSSTTGAGGFGGSTTASTTSATTTGTGGSTTTGTGGSTTAGSGGSTTAGSGGAMPQIVTIPDVTGGAVGPGVDVTLLGVVAMSQKFLVSKGAASGSCLWGIFVSAPGLAETAPHAGILVLSYGTNAMIPPGGGQAICPRLGIDQTGDKIPDNTQPGHVLDVVGETSYFLLPQCAMQPNGSTIAEYQITKSASITKVGVGPVPAPHVLTPAELAQLAAGNNVAFFEAWGGVKVALANVESIPEDDGMGGVSITDNFGHMRVHAQSIPNPTPSDEIQVGDKIYYRGYLAANDPCHAGPKYANADTVFPSMAGFTYLDFCTWSIAPNDKCADLDPFGTDCTSAVMCVQP